MIKDRELDLSMLPHLFEPICCKNTFTNLKTNNIKIKELKIRSRNLSPIDQIILKFKDIEPLINENSDQKPKKLEHIISIESQRKKSIFNLDLSTFTRPKITRDQIELSLNIKYKSLN